MYWSTSMDQVPSRSPGEVIRSAPLRFAIERIFAPLRFEAFLYPPIIRPTSVQRKRKKLEKSPSFFQFSRTEKHDQARLETATHFGPRDGGGCVIFLILMHLSKWKQIAPVTVLAPINAECVVALR
jgi:hypothetical protein